MRLRMTGGVWGRGGGDEGAVGFVRLFRNARRLAHGFRAILERAGARRAADLETAFHRCEPEVEAGEYRSYREVTRLALERAMRRSRRRAGTSRATAIADEWESLPVFADAPRTLRRLHDEGWLLAVLTNCDVDLFALTAPDARRNVRPRRHGARRAQL